MFNLAAARDCDPVAQSSRGLHDIRDIRPIEPGVYVERSLDRFSDRCVGLVDIVGPRAGVCDTKDVSLRRQVDGREHARAIARVARQRLVGRIAESDAELIRQEQRVHLIEPGGRLLGLPEAITLDEDAARLRRSCSLRQEVVEQCRRPCKAACYVEHNITRGNRWPATGYEAGNQVLVQVAAGPRSGVSPFDTVARYDGAEFAVLLFKLLSHRCRHLLAGLRALPACVRAPTHHRIVTELFARLAARCAHLGADTTQVDLMH